MVEEESQLIPEEEGTCCGRMCCCPSKVNGCMRDMYFPKRISLLVVLTLGMTLVNAQRVNVGVTVVPILHKGTSNKVTKPETMAEVCMSLCLYMCLCVCVYLIVWITDIVS